MNWMERISAAFGGRSRGSRESEIYPRLFSMFSNKRPLPKYSPMRLRNLSRTVYARRAMNAIKDPIKQMAWDIRPKKNLKMNSELRAQILAATRVFEEPNEGDSFMSFVEQVLEDYMAVSSGVYEQQPTGDKQRPLMLYPTDGQSIQIIPDWNGSPLADHFVQVPNMAVGSMNNMIEFPDQNMVYMRPNPSTETPYGFGPLEICARNIARQLGVADFAGDVSTNASPSNLIWIGPADSATLNNFRKYWMNEVEGQGVVPIMGGAMEPKAVKLHGASDDALYLKWQQFLIHELATGFNLTADTFNPMETDSRNTMQESQTQNWLHAIRPTAKTLQSQFTRHTLNKGMGFTQLEFVFDGLDREDEKELAEIYKIYYQNNLTTPNEFRIMKLGIEPSDNDWSDKTYGDMQIAIGNARRGSETGSADLLDDPKTVKSKAAAPNRQYPSRG